LAIFSDFKGLQVRRPDLCFLQTFASLGLAPHRRATGAEDCSPLAETEKISYHDFIKSESQI